MHQIPNARSEFLDGIRAFVPLIMATVPFGVACGTAAISSGLTPWQAFSTSVIIFAGSSQIAATQLLASGTPTLVIISTAAVVNLRFMMYSASLSPYLGTINKRWHILLSYLITDQACALGITRYMQKGDISHRHWFLLGVSGATWLCWQISTILGILLGSLIPQDWSIDFVLPLTFIALVVPLCSSKAMTLAAISGGAASVLLILPLKLNLIAAAMIGIVVGLLAEKIGRRK